MDKAAFGEYMHDLENEAAGIGLKPGWVPATKYILVNDQPVNVAYRSRQRRSM